MTTFTIAIVCEAPADAQTAQILVDELLCRDVDWINPDDINDHRRFCGYQSSEPLLWRQIRKLADELL